MKEFIVRRSRANNCWVVADSIDPDFTSGYIVRGGVRAVWDPLIWEQFDFDTKEEAELALWAAKIRGDAQ